MCEECSVLSCCCRSVRLPASHQACGADSVLLCLLRATDAGLVYLRRIKDLAAPDDEDQRPPCVDMRVRVGTSCKRTTDHVRITPAAAHSHWSCHPSAVPCQPAGSVTVGAAAPVCVSLLCANRRPCMYSACRCWRQTSAGPTRRSSCTCGMQQMQSLYAQGESTLFLSTSSANHTLSVATRLLLLLHSCQALAAGAEEVERVHVPQNMQSRRSSQE